MPWRALTFDNQWQIRAWSGQCRQNLQRVNLKYEINNENEVINVKMENYHNAKKIMKIFKNTKNIENIGQG